MKAAILIAAAVLLGAAAPVTPSGKPESAPQAAPDAAKAQPSSKDGLTAYERESLAIDRAANRVGESANRIADAQRVYGLIQLFMGFAGVAFTGVAAFWAWRATHWAKQAATHAQTGADAALDQLEAAKVAERAYIATNTTLVMNAAGELHLAGGNNGRSVCNVMSVHFVVRSKLPAGPSLRGLRMAKREPDLDVLNDGKGVIFCILPSPIPASARHVLGYVRYRDVFNAIWRVYFRYDLTAGDWKANGAAKWHRVEAEKRQEA